MKHCPNCGTQLADDSRFCTECGKEYPQGNVCPHCGVSVNEGDAFCYNCGKSLKEAPIEEPAQYDDEEEEKSGFKKYLPYIIGALAVLALIGYYTSKEAKGGDDSRPQTIVTDSMNTDMEAPPAINNSVIADYDEKKVFQGEYEFDAILTDAALEKTNSTFTIKIDGNKVYVPMDEGKTMTGYIYNDDLGIDVLYDYGDDLHWISLTLKPNDKEGKEWVGEFAFTGMLFNAVLKLKECKSKGKVVKVTEERTANNDSNEAETNDLDWLQGHWVYEQGSYKGHFIIRGDKIIQYSSMNPEHQEATFRVEDGAIRARLIDGMDLVVPIDFASHRIDYGNGNWMHKIE